MTRIFTSLLFTLLLSCTNNASSNQEIKENSGLDFSKKNPVLEQLIVASDSAVSNQLFSFSKLISDSSSGLPTCISWFNIENALEYFALTHNNSGFKNLLFDSDLAFLIGIEYNSPESTHFAFNSFTGLLHRANSDSLSAKEYKTVYSFFKATKSGVFMTWLANYIILIPKSCKKPLIMQSWVNIEKSFSVLSSKYHFKKRDRFEIVKRHCNSALEFRMQVINITDNNNIPTKN